MMQPALHRSEVSSQGKPRTTSGARNCRVPTRPLCRSSGKTALPKSMTVIWQSRSLIDSASATRGCGRRSELASRSITFRHFRSVCVTPIACRKAKLLSNWYDICLMSARKRPMLSFSLRKSRMLVSRGSKTMQKCWLQCKNVLSSWTHWLFRSGSMRMISLSTSASASACSQKRFTPLMTFTATVSLVVPSTHRSTRPKVPSPRWPSTT
mmetsp:Transcript_85452/g.242270  ORF Transcript_85452/g.242270 Transcript_85452/m.242270 type:complete len:210 (+) Transcript_85452:369-998(+)